MSAVWRVLFVLHLTTVANGQLHLCAIVCTPILRSFGKVNFHLAAPADAEYQYCKSQEQDGSRDTLEARSQAYTTSDMSEV